MKSAYELAMERLSQSAPITKLTDKQKKQLAELDSKYAAKIAEHEIYAKDRMAVAAAKGDGAELETLEAQLVEKRRALQAELEEKKDQVRQSGGKQR